MAYKVYRGRVLNPRGPEEFDPGYLAVDAAGRISGYGPWDERELSAGDELVDYDGKLISPGSSTSTSTCRSSTSAGAMGRSSWSGWSGMSDFEQEFLVLKVDLTGLVASKGYFAGS